MTAPEKWIAAAFGRDGLRAWAMHGARPDAQLALPPRARAGWPDVQLALLADLPDDWRQPGQTLVVACGLKDAPYQAIPVAPGKLRPLPVPAEDARLDLFALSGLRQTAPPDVICGDETRIAGFLAAHAGWDGVICLTGPQSCWAHISAGEVVSFQTFLTGEIYTAVSQNAPAVADWDMAAFTDAVEITLSRPEKLAAALASVRARDVLQDQSAQQAQARLWGALIGAELAAARPYWLGQQLAVIGPTEITALYRAALEPQGVPTETAEDDQTTLAGLTAAWRQMQ
jgi:2-dehydro-3-deoxygalactonokinase